MLNKTSFTLFTVDGIGNQPVAVLIQDALLLDIYSKGKPSEVNFVFFTTSKFYL